MGFLIPIIVIVVVTLILSKAGVSEHITTTVISGVGALVLGGGSGGATIGFTKSPIIGLIVAIFVGTFVFIKIFKLLTRKKEANP